MKIIFELENDAIITMKLGKDDIIDEIIKQLENKGVKITGFKIDMEME